MIVKVAGGDVGNWGGAGGLIVTFKRKKQLFHVNKISKFWVIDLYEIYIKKEQKNMLSYDGKNK